MIAINRDALSDREFIQILQGMSEEVIERVGHSQSAAVMLERTRLLYFGENDQCEWDGNWPRMKDGHIVRTPEYYEFMERIGNR